MRAAIVAALACAVVALAPVAAGAGDPAPSRLLVSGEEFDLRLSRAKIDPGPALVEFLNAGEDPHDLRMQRLGASTYHVVPETLPSELRRFGVGHLKRRATYRLWCSLSGHAEAGMEAFLKVRRRPAR